MAITVISGAAIIELLGNPKGCPIYMTVANGTAIGKGSLLKITDARTAAQSAATTDKFAGIAAADKEADDGSTRLAVWTKGIFDLYSIGSVITAGAWVALSGANYIRAAVAADMENGTAFGKALETTTTAEERIAVAVGLY